MAPIQDFSGKKYGVPVFLPSGNVNPAYLAAEKKAKEEFKKKNFSKFEAIKAKQIAKKVRAARPRKPGTAALSAAARSGVRACARRGSSCGPSQESDAVPPNKKHGLAWCAHARRAVFAGVSPLQRPAVPVHADPS
jgi:hypothetical protein